MKNWKTLSKKQKNIYKNYCDKKFGETRLFCETGEPMYLDDKMNKYDSQAIIKFLFSSNPNERIN